MKLLAFNGSPRKNKNTATMLNAAVDGARSAGAEVELFNLYSLKFSGCISCFSCKKLSNKRPIVCAIKDDLRPLLEKVQEADALLIGTPVYYGCETAGTRALIERLCFPYLNYANYAQSHIPRKIPVGLIYTMNVTEENFSPLGYDVTFGRTQSTLARELGACEVVRAHNTVQFTDYSKYEANATQEEKEAYKNAHFADDCRRAQDLGKRLVTGQVK